ncbi:MAG: YeeE/YedE thiosulfate transporter family protein [Candidatus Hermodarchaeota archaeon]
MSDEAKEKISKIIKIPAFLGFVIGILAAFGQALLISAGGPEAYGFCVACHTRDLMNRIVNSIAGSTIVGLAPISALSILPVLTMVGVFIGGYAAAKSNKEFKIKKSPPLTYVIYLIGGILVLCFALLLGGCPYRAALRFAYGDLVALIGILSMAGGVFVGVQLLLYKMEKGGA